MNPKPVAYNLKVRNYTLSAIGKIEPEESNLNMRNAVCFAFDLKGWPSIKENTI